MKNRMKKVVALGLVLVSMAGTNVYAASYSGYCLGALQTNKYTNTHCKKTSDNYIAHKVTALSNTNAINTWGCDGNHNQITQTYTNVGVNSSRKMKFTNGNYANVGQQVSVGMENATWTTSRAFASGQIHFH